MDMWVTRTTTRTIRPYDKLGGFHITAVTASLHSLVRGYFGVSSRQAFEGVLAFCGFQLDSFGERLDASLPIVDFTLDDTNRDTLTQYCSALATLAFGQPNCTSLVSSGPHSSAGYSIRPRMSRPLWRILGPSDAWLPLNSEPRRV
jgi:hypothetical protein